MASKGLIKAGIITGILLIVVIPKFYELHKNKNNLKNQIRKQKQRISELQDQNLALEEEIKLLKDDPNYKEEVARNEMGLVKEGEVIYRRQP
jgi:cell division protein FtsB